MDHGLISSCLRAPQERKKRVHTIATHYTPAPGRSIIYLYTSMHSTVRSDVADTPTHQRTNAPLLLYHCSILNIDHEGRLMNNYADIEDIEEPDERVKNINRIYSVHATLYN